MSPAAVRGVQFIQEPTYRPYGIEATFRANSGDWLSLTRTLRSGGTDLPSPDA